MSDRVTTIIHTHNFEKEIGECIASTKLLTQKIIVIDMDSIDKTKEIANKQGAKIYSFPYSKIVEPAREFGISKSETEWVFLLDADERMTKELVEEIKETIKNDKNTFYKVPRKEILFHKKWLQHGGWWPNHQIRLIKKEAMVKWPTIIHSTPVIKGKIGYLNSPLLHYSQNDFSEIVKKTLIFEDLESDLLFNAGRKVSNLTFFRKFFGELYRRLIKQLGFMDGEIGIIESIYQAFSKTITYLFLYEKKNSRPL